NVTVTVQNLESAPYTMDTRVEILDPYKQLVHQADYSSPLDSEGSAVLTTSYALPVDAARGYFSVVAETHYEGALRARETTRFWVPFPELELTALEPATYL
ncbi:MAG: hypothetical protein GWN58_36070, partial [Anaerolineae bacterium]|nr:hypothetical protein [Anaerolineae bacterium]